MENFWKAIGVALVCAVVCLAVEKREKDLALVMSMAGICAVAAGATVYLRPVVALMEELETTAGLEGGSLGVLLKAVGIGLVSQLAAGICADAGSGGLAKTLQMLGSAAILCLSAPLAEEVLALIREILGML